MRWHERLTRRSAKLNALSLISLPSCAGPPTSPPPPAHHLSRCRPDTLSLLTTPYRPFVPPARGVWSVPRGLRVAAVPTHGFPVSVMPSTWICSPAEKSCQMMRRSSLAMPYIRRWIQPPHSGCCIVSRLFSSGDLPARPQGQPFGGNELAQRSCVKRPSCVAATGTWCLATARLPAKDVGFRSITFPTCRLRTEEMAVYKKHTAI